MSEIHDKYYHFVTRSHQRKVIKAIRDLDAEVEELKGKLRKFDVLFPEGLPTHLFDEMSLENKIKAP